MHTSPSDLASFRRLSWLGKPPEPKRRGIRTGRDGVGPGGWSRHRRRPRTSVQGVWSRGLRSSLGLRRGGPRAAAGDGVFVGRRVNCATIRRRERRGARRTAQDRWRRARRGRRLRRGGRRREPLGSLGRAFLPMASGRTGRPDDLLRGRTTGRCWPRRRGRASRRRPEHREGARHGELASARRIWRAAGGDQTLRRTPHVVQRLRGLCVGGSQDHRLFARRRRASDSCSS